MNTSEEVVSEAMSLLAETARQNAPLHLATMRTS